MSAPSSTVRTSHARRYEPTGILVGAALGAVTFFLLNWSSVHWLQNADSDVGGALVLLAAVLVAVVTLLSVRAPRVGVAAGVVLVALVLLGRLLGHPGDVTLSAGGFQPPLTLLRSGAHQPVVAVATAAVLAAATASRVRLGRSLR
ncbi:hypothetical protein [Kineococcus arenarius]|uniref:hypothetical protein n=1 Tax=unclassified Kineococcus TaxID=2621656 RepID=UPI003D7DB486